MIRRREYTVIKIKLPEGHEYLAGEYVYVKRGFHYPERDKISKEVWHREDGPATIIDGIPNWWFDDSVYTFEAWLHRVQKRRKLDEAAIAELILKYG